MSDDDPTGPGRPQSSGKRKAVQWSSKIEIFNDWKHHRNTLSMEEFARKLKKPRSSVAGFIKEVNMFLMKPIQLAIQPHACRRVQPRALILEEILAQWLRDLGSRGIPVSNKKITGQAFHIQRLLNELLIKPLHYEYSPSWINNFRKRQNITIEAMPSQPTENDKTIVAHTTMAYDLDRTDLNDIYTCDVANMFLMIDDSLHGMKQNGAVVGGNSSSVSVLLCCNATGSDRRDPFILVRQNENTPTAGKHGGAVLDAVLDDLTANHFESWLIEMDGSLDRNIKLLLDRTMWDLLHQSSKACLVPPLRSRIPLKHIEIIAASNRLGAWLPMSTRILKEFKTWYYTTLCEMELKCFGPMDKLLSHLRLIPKAWGRVHEATIRTSFNRFLNLGNPDRPSLKPDHYRDSDDHAETAFRIALSKAYPNIKKKSLNSHLTQDKDMGPSGFIRSRIYEMQSRPEFKDHFKMNTSFGGVHCVNKRPMSGKIIRFEDIQHKEKFWGEKGRPWQDEEAGLPAQAKLPYARHSHHGPAEAFSVVQVWTV
ncbi:hypothetical protein EDD11_010362 [Mortierella claussenii]|nr:hypothetical protein EDD11_010362 [Mortierella claussenii]